MRASVQSQVQPHSASRETTFNNLTVEDKKNAVDSNAETKTSFKDLLTQSNTEIKEERKAKKAKDYSNLSEKDFLKQLQEDSKPKREPKNKLGKDDFLKLFVAQLQHQDPLSPDDGAEMASKLAQFNSLEQQVNTNKNLDTMISAQTTSQNRQLVNYIGNDVKLEGGHIKVAQGKPENIKFDIPVNASTSTLVVRNSDGVKVAQQDLGTLPMGEHQIGWDGKGINGKPVSNGMYTFDIKAKSLDGQEMEVPISTPTKILGVDLKDGDRSLYTTYGRVSMDQISAIGSTGFLDLAPTSDLLKNKKPLTDANNQTEEIKPIPVKKNSLATENQPPLELQPPDKLVKAALESSEELPPASGDSAFAQAQKPKIKLRPLASPEGANAVNL